MGRRDRNQGRDKGRESSGGGRRREREAAPEPAKPPRKARAGAEGKLPPGQVIGMFQGIARGGGFCIPEEGNGKDIRIDGRDAGEALHGDRVQVEIDREGRDGRLAGHVVKVLLHRNKMILGRLTHTDRGAVVVPKNRKLNRHVLIRKRLDMREVPEGAWVMVEVTDWSRGADEPLLGQLSEVVGMEGDKGLPILLLIKQGGVEIEFPEEVEREANALLGQETIAQALADKYEPRRDLRTARVMTIDPLTAKDFDDAIHLVEKVGSGWRVGVHIADVAHYVKPGTALDADAYERATSIYPVDRVIPMLPEALSNGVCSLRPDEEKLTMSVDFTVGVDGEVSNVELYASVIKSARRFAYEEVQGLFDRADGVDTKRPAPDIPDALRADLFEIRQASRALAAARTRRGSLDLDLPETKVVFDADGKVADLVRAERFEAHRLIEELMIAANEAVARELGRKRFPLLYRVHAEPEETKLMAIAPAMGRMGIPVKLHKKGAFTRAQMQELLTKAREHPAGAVVQRWVLRAMMRAKYQPENIGHYGLASTDYVHFTSPIRRYPDLLVHRAVKLYLRGLDPQHGEVAALADSLPAAGRHCSAREERAQKIEWDATEILAMEFMRRFVGDVFEGFISGVTGMGFYVEFKDYPVEGLIRISQLDDDFYDLDDENHVWRGRSSGRSYAVGDPATVLIEKIDVLAGQMDLLLIRKRTNRGGRPARNTRGPAPRRRGR